MAIKLSNLFLTVKEDLIEHLDSSMMQLGFSKYGVPTMQPCINFGDIVDFNIEQLVISKTKANKANIGLSLTYNIMSVEQETVKKVTKQNYFMLLNSEADFEWTYGMIQKVWEGNYPSSVAIDQKGNCYFVYVESWGIHFSQFATLSEMELEMISSYLNDDTPYKIVIEPIAMFRVLDGAEGYNYLRKHIMVEFNCNKKLSVMVEDFGGFE